MKQNESTQTLINYDYDALRDQFNHLIDLMKADPLDPQADKLLNRINHEMTTLWLASSFKDFEMPDL